MIWIIDILILNLAVVFVTELTAAYAFGSRTPTKLATVALVNVITNPPLVVASLWIAVFYEIQHVAGLILFEVLAVVTEGFIFSKYNTFDRGNPYFISLVLNIISFLTGELINIIL